MFSSFDDESIVCKSFQDFHLNESLKETEHLSKSAKHSSRAESSMGQNILLSLKKLQDRLNALDSEKSQLIKDKEKIELNLEQIKSNTSVASSTSKLLESAEPSVHSTRSSSSSLSQSEKSFHHSIRSPAPEVLNQTFRTPNIYNKTESPRFQSLITPASSKQHQRNDTRDLSIQQDMVSEGSIMDDSFKPCQLMLETSTMTNISACVDENGKINVCESEKQFESATAKCEMLERQLEMLREKVCNAERDRALALENQIKLEREKSKLNIQNRKKEFKRQMLTNLETQNSELSQQNNLFVERLETLRKDLETEKQERQKLIDRAQELENREKARLLLDEYNMRKISRTPPPKKVSDREFQRKARRQSRTRSTSPHYRVNIHDLPFLTGTSATKSPAFAAQIQNVLFDLKLHNPKVCGYKEKVMKRKVARKAFSVSSGEKSDDTTEWEQDVLLDNLEQNFNNFEELLGNLEAEFGEILEEHCILKKQLELLGEKSSEELKSKIMSVGSKLKEKAQMIVTIRQHLKDQVELNKKLKKDSVTPKRVKAAVERSYTRSNSIGRPGLIAKQRKEMLKNVKAFHQELKKDDLSWD